MVENTGEKTLKNEEADSKKEQIEDVFIVPIADQAEPAANDLINSNLNSLSERAASILSSASEKDIVFQFNSEAIINALQISAEISESITKVTEYLTEIASQVFTPMLDWLRSIDFSPILKSLQKLQLGIDFQQSFKELKEVYLIALYDSEWFPYAGWIAGLSLFNEINEIIKTSKGASKRRLRRIDKAILSYYSDARIHNLKKRWWKSDLDHHIRRILGQAIEAYLRGEYALTISCLSTMWEGLIYMKANNASAEERRRQKTEAIKREMKDLVEQNNMAAVFSDYFEKCIMSQCNAVEEVKDGVPNRHGVAHSWYRKYPNKKAALNAILLTDFIIQLNPIRTV